MWGAAIHPTRPTPTSGMSTWPRQHRVGHPLGHDWDVVIVWRRRDRIKRREVAATQDHRGEDLSRARLVGMDLRGKDFSRANLEWADMTECDLSGARLSDANLHGAYLTGAQCDRADLSRARLDDAYLLATNF